MKFLFKGKDGGPDSNVTGYWLFESKRFCSVVLLCFDKGSREAFHTHAFNGLSWVLSGWLHEYFKDGREKGYLASPFPIYTPRDRFHRVEGVEDKTWVLSFRGPWSKTWKEYLSAEDKEITLSNGRKEVSN